MSKPSHLQVSALQLFAARNGRIWKACLRHCWETGNYSDAPDGTSSYLQMVRNDFGPSWLISFRLPV